MGAAKGKRQKARAMQQVLGGVCGSEAHQISTSQSESIEIVARDAGADSSTAPRRSLELPAGIVQQVPLATRTCNNGPVLHHARAPTQILHATVKTQRHDACGHTGT